MTSRFMKAFFSMLLLGVFMTLAATATATAQCATDEYPISLYYTVTIGSTSCEVELIGCAKYDHSGFTINAIRPVNPNPCSLDPYLMIQKAQDMAAKEFAEQGSPCPRDFTVTKPLCMSQDANGVWSGNPCSNLYFLFCVTTYRVGNCATPNPQDRTATRINCSPTGGNPICPTNIPGVACYWMCECY